MSYASVWMGQLDRSDTTSSQKNSVKHLNLSPSPSHLPKASKALVVSLVWRVSMGNGNNLLSGDTSAVCQQFHKRNCKVLLKSFQQSLRERVTNIHTSWKPFAFIIPLGSIGLQLYYINVVTYNEYKGSQLPSISRAS